MISVLQRHFEKILLGVAIAGLLAGAGWAWRQERSLHKARPLAASRVPSVAAYVPTALALTERPNATWRQPPVQSAGSGWVYELFTPPTIYYNAAARCFAVTSSEDATPTLEEGGRLQLVAVRLEPYRLQLTGYFGAPDDYVAAFTIPGSPETVLAHAGQRFEQLGLTLENFEVRKVPVEHGDPWPVCDLAGLATLRDERTGGQVVLDSRVRKLTSTPLAVLQLAGRRETRELHEGDAWVDGAVTYRVERIQLEPTEVVVTQTGPGLHGAEMKLGHPPAARGDSVVRQASAARDDTSFHPRNVANNGP